MGQEWAAPEPFLFFSDLGQELGPAIAEGRRREFAGFPEFRDPDARARIPDPLSADTRLSSTLDWDRLADPAHQEWLALHRELLWLRDKEIAPLLAGDATPRAAWRPIEETALEAEWRFPSGRVLRVVCNLGAAPAAHAGPGARWGRPIYRLDLPGDRWTALPPWSVGWYLAEPEGGT
jgi:maltooligosyltrehalose trehalohydrolase